MVFCLQPLATISAVSTLFARVSVRYLFKEMAGIKGELTDFTKDILSRFPDVQKKAAAMMESFIDTSGGGRRKHTGRGGGGQRAGGTHGERRFRRGEWQQ